MKIQEVVIRTAVNKLLKEQGIKFSSYYKYVFYFESTYPELGYHIVGTIGGNADDIYRLEVKNVNYLTINDLDSIMVYKDKEVVFKKVVDS